MPKRCKSDYLCLSEKCFRHLFGRCYHRAHQGLFIHGENSRRTFGVSPIFAQIFSGKFQGPKFIFANESGDIPGNTMLGNQGQFLSVHFMDSKPSMTSLNRLIDTGSSGISLDNIFLVSIN